MAFKAPVHPGVKPQDLAYRSGVLKWDVPQGMWGIMRVKGQEGNKPTTNAVTVGLVAVSIASVVAASLIVRRWLRGAR